MLDGAARVGDLVGEAARMEMPAIAMSDHGNLYGAYDFYKQSKAAGIKPIIGIEGYYAPQGRFERAPFDFGGGYDEGVGYYGRSLDGAENFGLADVIGEVDASCGTTYGSQIWDALRAGKGKLDAALVAEGGV